MAVIGAPGRTAIASKGWLRAHKWLLARRVSQLGILMLFLLGPLAGIWIVKGNLSSSMTLDVLPLTDPLLLIQVLLTGQVPEFNALIGALIVVVFYALVGGRVFCSWVCPVNIVTDTAAWLRRKLGIRSTGNLSRNARYWALAMVLVLAMVTGTLVWELFNPVSMLHRGLIFGMGMAWVVLLGVFLFDLLIARHGWCGHVCPVGAFYGLLGQKSLIRVGAVQRTLCDDCMDCFEVCPEPQVIRPALKGEEKGIGPVILDTNCTNCGRCIDVCQVDVFRFGGRAAGSADPGAKRGIGADYPKTIKDGV